MFIAASHWSGVGPLASAMPPIIGSLWAPLRYPLVLYYEDAAVFEPVGLSPSFAPTVHRLGRHWRELTHSPGSEAGW